MKRPSSACTHLLAARRCCRSLSVGIKQVDERQRRSLQVAIALPGRLRRLKIRHLRYLAPYTQNLRQGRAFHLDAVAPMG